MRLTATQKEEERVQREGNQECILPQTSWGKRFQRHRKPDAIQECEGDGFRGNEEAEQLDT